MLLAPRADSTFSSDVSRAFAPPVSLPGLGWGATRYGTESPRAPRLFPTKKASELRLTLHNIEYFSLPDTFYTREKIMK